MMFAYFGPIDSISRFMDAGGPVLWLILCLSVLLWSLIIERYWYLYKVHPGVLRNLVEQFSNYSASSTWHEERIREAIVSQVGLNLSKSLMLIKTLIMLCPLLGLLGTVTGMIHVFDVVAITGTSNAKEMASGISMATIPTMAGLVTALSGYYFSIRLKQHANREKMLTADLIKE